MKWIRYNQAYPQRWSFKQDIPAPWQRWAKKVTFPFETVWIVRDENRLVYMPDGQWAETFDFFLRTPGHVIGLADLSTADAHDWAIEWRAAMTDRRLQSADKGVSA